MEIDRKPYVLNRLPNKTAELRIYERIGGDMWEEGVTAKQFANDLQALGDVRRIDVRINSPGGSVFDGLAMYNALVQHPAQVVVHVDGMAMSMASGVAMAGDVVNMAENAIMMVHNPRTMVAGEAKDLEQALNVLQTIKQSLLVAYRNKTGLDDDELSAMLDATTFLTAEQAVERGFADAVVSPMKAVAACIDMESIANHLPPGVSVPAHVVTRLTQFHNHRELEMSESNAAANAATIRPVAATIQDLEALAGADAQFVVEQLKANATLQQATNALNVRLAARLEEAENRLKNQAAASAPQAPATSAPATPATLQNVTTAETADDFGSAPLNDNRSPGTTQQESNVTSMADQWEREFLRLRAEGKSADDCCRIIDEQHPEWKANLLAALDR